MDDVRSAMQAIANSLVKYIQQSGNTKYRPIAVREEELKRLIVKGDYEDVHVKDLPAGQYGVIREIDNINTLVIDTDNIPKEVLSEHVNILSKAHEASNGFAVENRGGIAKTMKTDSSKIDTIFNRYEDRLPRRLLPVFEEALVLRATERKQNLSRGTVYDWRGEIANQHRRRRNDPQEAHHLISLCSAGYFDEGNVFDDMYLDLVGNGTNTKREYKQVIDRFIRDNPFAVFVRANGMTAEEVCVLTTDKAKKIGRYPWSPGFIDICGKGEETHDIIDQARHRLNAEYGAEAKEYRDREIEQYILRVSPDSL